MSIVRICHDKEKPYVQINRQSAQDPEMSWSARGLWAYLISLPDNWEVSVAHLTKFYTGQRRGNKRDALYDMLAELESLGYVQREQVRAEKGHFARVDYVVFEGRQPIQSVATGRPEKLKEKVPLTDKPLTDKRVTVKPTQTIRYDKEEIETKNDINVSDDRSCAAHAPIVSFDPETYTMPNGNRLSLQMRRCLAKYTPEQMRRASANVQYFEKMLKQGTKPANFESYLQACISKNYAQGEDNAWKNRIYALLMKEEHNLHKLEILKTVIRFQRSVNEPPESISYSLPTETFETALEKYIEITKGN